MPTSSSVTSRESQAAIVTALISTDPEMQTLARQYVLLGLREMLNQLVRGDAATKASIAKSMSGVVANLFTQQGGDDGLGELREEMHGLISEMRGEMGAHEEREEELSGPGIGIAGQTQEAASPPARVMVPKS